MPDARDAEVELCRRFAPRIRLYGIKHLGSEERAAELVQRVLLAVLEALRAERIEQPELIDRYVLGTCRHLADRIRRGDARCDPLEPDALPLVATQAPDPLDVGALMRCMVRLDTRGRSVLLLSFYREKSADEIAGAMGMTAGNVRVVRHRALAALRRCIEQGEAR
jgi:RNA polymerase sigma-70 factor (ECF subfamily)